MILLSEENWLKALDNKILIRIFGAKKDEN